MFTSQSLDVNLYKQFHKKFVNYRINPFALFLYLLDNLWCKYPENNTEIFKRVFGDVDFSSQSEIETALQLFMEFNNAIVSFLGQIENVEDKDQLEEPISLLWNEIVKDYSNHRGILEEIIMDAANKHLVKVLKENGVQITENDDIESLQIKVRSRVKHPISDYVFILINITGEYEENALEPEEFKYIFSLLILSSALQNLSRKESMSIKMKGNVNRNSLCPCGSGKKYKFCCGQI